MESLLSSMTQKKLELHFVLIPLMAPGHLLPMVDMARLLARRSVKVTLVTTPLNAMRVKATIERENQNCSSSSQQIIELRLFQFPSADSSGVPEGCESVDALTSMDVKTKFFIALCKLQKPLEELFETLTTPPPTCIISDRYVPSVAAVARKFQVPRIIFDGTNCFNLLCSHSLWSSKVYERVLSDSEEFVVPGLPHRIAFKRPQIPGTFNLRKLQDINEFLDQVRKTEKEAYGVVVNSFQELEDEYVKEYEKVTGQKIWCIGPVSLCNKDNMDRAQRGKVTDSNEKQSSQYLKWLDSWPARSVIYVCLGSLNYVPPKQLMELGLGLEATKRPFILVLRASDKRDEMEKILMEDGLEERVKERGMIIRGWVPQVLILSHTAIGSFITHCGWNSTLEGICSGVPLITFPLSAEQFYNEKVVVQLLGTGMRVGVETAINFGEEDKYGVQVNRENVKEAIEKVMGEEDEESERIRERARNYAEKANKAMQKGGSSWLNMSLLIEDITHVMGLKFNDVEAAYDDDDDEKSQTSPNS